MWTLRVFLYAIHILGYKWSVTTGRMYCLLAVEDSLKYAGFKVHFVFVVYNWDVSAGW